MKSNGGTGLGQALEEIAQATSSHAGQRAIERLYWVLCVGFYDVFAAESAFEEAYDGLVDDVEQRSNGEFEAVSSALEDVYDRWLATVAAEPERHRMAGPVSRRSRPPSARATPVPRRPLRARPRSLPSRSRGEIGSAESDPPVPAQWRRRPQTRPSGKARRQR